MQTGDIRVLHVGLDPSEARVSGDGSTVVFGSSTGPAPHRLRLYAVDLATGVVTLASGRADGVPANGDTRVVGVSADGRRVAMSSAATNLDARDRNTREDLYVKDISTGSIELASTTVAGVRSEGPTYLSVGDLSDDGTALAFISSARDLDPRDPDAVYDGYVKFLGGVQPRSQRVAEDGGGARVVPFTIAISRPLSTRVSVAFATGQGTATAGQDYVPTNGRVAIPAGQRRTVVFITLLPDGTAEPDETFTLKLTDPVGAGIRYPTATATITDDD